MVLCFYANGFGQEGKVFEVEEIACATSSKNVCQSSSLYFPKEDPCAVYIYASVTGLL